MQIALASLDSGHIGIAETAYESALAYAHERIQFDRPLIENQAIAFKLADMHMRIDAGKMLLYKAAWLKDQRRYYILGTSQAKLFCLEMCNFIADAALQIHGGYGCVAILSHYYLSPFLANFSIIICEYNTEGRYMTSTSLLFSLHEGEFVQWNTQPRLARLDFYHSDQCLEGLTYQAKKVGIFVKDKEVWSRGKVSLAAYFRHAAIVISGNESETYFLSHYIRGYGGGNGPSKPPAAATLKAPPKALPLKKPAAPRAIPGPSISIEERTPNLLLPVVAAYPVSEYYTAETPMSKAQKVLASRGSNLTAQDIMSLPCETWDFVFSKVVVTCLEDFLHFSVLSGELDKIIYCLKKGANPSKGHLRSRRIADNRDFDLPYMDAFKRLNTLINDDASKLNSDQMTLLDVLIVYAPNGMDPNLLIHRLMSAMSSIHPYRFPNENLIHYLQQGAMKDENIIHCLTINFSRFDWSMQAFLLAQIYVSESHAMLLIAEKNNKDETLLMILRSLQDCVTFSPDNCDRIHALLSGRSAAVKELASEICPPSQNFQKQQRQLVAQADQIIRKIFLKLPGEVENLLTPASREKIEVIVQTLLISEGMVLPFFKLDPLEQTALVVEIAGVVSRLVSKRSILNPATNTLDEQAFGEEVKECFSLWKLQREKKVQEEERESSHQNYLFTESYRQNEERKKELELQAQLLEAESARAYRESLAQKDRAKMLANQEKALDMRRQERLYKYGHP